MPPTPAISWMCGEHRTLSTCVFGCVARKELTGAISGSVASKELRDWRLEARGWTEKMQSVPRGERNSMRGVGVPLSLRKKESRNRRKGKGIEGIFRWKTTGLQRDLNGAMKGREREESNAQALGSWSGARGTRCFGVACNLICVGVASMIGFMDKITAGNTWRQLAGSGVWVQVAEIFKSGQKIQKLHSPVKDEACTPPTKRRKEKGRVAMEVGQES